MQLQFVKNETERRLLEELSSTSTAIKESLKQLQQAQQLLATYQALWSQLLVCQRSNLMPLIPLTSQRLEQLSAAVNSLAAALQTQLMPLQPQISGLALFASANKSTAEELLQAGTAGGLAADKLALSELERELVDSLMHATQYSSSCLRGTAGGATHQQQQPQMQQQQQPQTPHGHQQQLHQTPNTAAQLVGAASQSGSGSEHGLQQQLSGQRAPLPVSSGRQQSQGNTPLPQHHQQPAAAASPGSLTSGSQDKARQEQQLQQGLMLRTASLPASQPRRPQDLILQGQQMLQQHSQHLLLPGKRKEPPTQQQQQQHGDGEALVRTHSLSGSLCKKQRSFGAASPQHCFGDGPPGADVQQQQHQQQQQQPGEFDVTRFSVLPAQLMMQQGRAAASPHQPPALCGPPTWSASLLAALQSAAAAAAAAEDPEDQQQQLPPPLDQQRQQELLQHRPTQRWSSAGVDLEPELLGAVRGAPLGASSPRRPGSAPAACVEGAAGMVWTLL